MKIRVLILSLALLAPGCATFRDLIVPVEPTPGTPEGPASPVPDPGPTPEARFDYNARNWWDGARVYGMNRLSRTMPEGVAGTIDAWRDGTTWETFVLFNAGDGPFGDASPYSDGFAGTLDPAEVARVRGILKGRRAEGKRINLFLETDDSPPADRAPLAKKIVHFDKMNAAFGDLVDAWTSDLEANEDATLKNDANHAALIAHIKAATSTPVFCHFTRTDAARALKVGADGHFGQVAASASAATVAKDTAKAVKILHPAGKLFVAFEHGHSNPKGNGADAGGEADRARGQAALANGADGTGSGR